MGTYFFTKNLDVVFMVYGLAFVAMGIVILAQQRRGSIFKLADVIWILAGFGLIHGVNEWLDMFGIIEINKYLHDMCILHDTHIFRLTRLTLLTVSYVFLFEFGRRLISFRLKKLSSKWVITVFLCFVVLALMIFIKQERSVWPRYFLGFPGGVFAALGFIWYYYDNETILKPIRARLYFITAAVSLCVYGVLGGVVVPKTDFPPASIINTDSFLKLFGIPVQVFRAICAIVLAWAVCKVLNIFNWEIRDKLKKSLVDLTVTKNYVDNILKSMIGSIIVVDMDKKIKTINPATLTLLGYDKDELIGMPITDLFAQENPHIAKNINIYKTCTELFKEYSVRGNEILYKTKDGRPIAVLYACSNIIGKDGQEEGYVISAADITERKRADEALKESEEKYRSVVDNIGIGVSLIGPDMEILALNKQMRIWFPDIDVSKKPICYRVFNNPPREDLCYYCPTCKTLADGEIHESITETPTKDKIVNYRIVSSPIKDSDSNVIAAIEMVEDITERKKAEEELKLAYQRLKETQSQLIQAEKMEVVGTIASGVAHEVKNPLAIILQSVEYLSKKVKTGDENVSLMIEDIKESVERADKIIKGLLDFSSASKVVMNFENPNSVIDGSLRLIKSQLLQAHIEIIKNLGEDIPLIKMDKNKIEQALIDLFINAMHAMPYGGKLTVKTFYKELEAQEKVVIIQIEDTGHGIPEAILGKIFNPFFTTRQREGGTGLGLSIARSIVEQHNGKIEIQNKKEGHGVIAEVMFKVS